MNRLSRLAVAVVLALPACAGLTSPGDAAADVARVRCEPEGTRVETASVLARPDGVHLEIDNRTGRQVYVYYRQGQDIANLQNLEAGTSQTVVTEGPGSWAVICSAPNQYPGEDDAWAPLRVVDPDGLWVSDRLDCEQVTGSHPDYREDFEGGTPPGREGDPADLAREDMAGGGADVRPGDVIERAGYPEALPRLVRLVRDGRVLAVGRYQADGRGGWIDRGVEYCEEERPGRPEPG